MNIILCTDASIVLGDIATWACYIDIDGKVIKQTGALKSGAKDSTTAEMAAVVNGLHLIKKELGDLSQTKTINIYTDNAIVVHIIRDLPSAKRKIIKNKDRMDHITKAQEYIKYFDGCYAKHVKGHSLRVTRAEDCKNRIIFMNHWCDVACNGLAKVIQAEQLIEKYT